MAGDNKSEKPTPRRLNKARGEGNYVVSKEFVAAVQFAAFFLIVVQFGQTFMSSSQSNLTGWLRLAFSAEPIDRESLGGLFRTIVAPFVAPIILVGAALTVATVGAQMAVSRLGFSAKKLAPNLNKLNPLSKLKELPRQNLISATQAFVLLPVFLYAVYYLAEERLGSFLGLPFQSVPAGALTIAESMRDLFWKATFLFLIIGVADWYRQQSRYTKQLKMSKHEVKEEHKESEGNPQIKGKLRKMQRDLSRRKMMSDVPKASAIVVNPTHYAVAIRYDVNAMAAPKIVAKGKNYLARRIREIATSNEIPIIENPPLARALYSSAEVGQEIPPHLYRAVAEILAYLYRLLGGRLPGTTNA